MTTVIWFWYNDSRIKIKTTLENSFMKSTLIILAAVVSIVAALAVGFYLSATSSEHGLDMLVGELNEESMVKLVAAEEFNSLISEKGTEAIILDVRTAEEYAEGHLPEAELLDVQAADFVSGLEGLDKEQAYFVYCRSGARSALATELMTQAGFSDIYELTGGIMAWEAAGFRVER